MECEHLDWIELVQGVVKLGTFVNSVMNILASQSGKFLHQPSNFSISKQTPKNGVY
jgi:hypothetical protein